MPEIKSPITNKKFGGNFERNRQNFDVPDESMPDFNPEELTAFQDRVNGMPPQYSADEMQSFNQIKKQVEEDREYRRSGKVKISEGSKKRIEMLIGLTRLTRDLELDGNLYSLQTLKSKEMREALVEAMQFDGSVQYIYEIRKQLLARSLTHIAGMDINQFLSSDTLESRYDLIDNLPEAILNRLFNEYQGLVKEASDKYAVKTAEEVPEVVGEIKKL